MASEKLLVGRLEAWDVGVIVIYFILVIGFGLWVSSDIDQSSCHSSSPYSLTLLLCSMIAAS